MARRLRKAKTVPPKRSSSNAALQSCASSSISLAKIDRLQAHENPHLRRDLQHYRASQKLRLGAARSGSGLPRNSIRIFASDAYSNSITQPPAMAGDGGVNSTNAGAATGSTRRGGLCSPSRFFNA